MGSLAGGGKISIFGTSVSGLPGRLAAFAHSAFVINRAVLLRSSSYGGHASNFDAWRRGPESNRRIEVLQTSALPLGYRAMSRKAELAGKNGARKRRFMQKLARATGWTIPSWAFSCSISINASLGVSSLLSNLPGLPTNSPHTNQAD